MPAAERFVVTRTIAATPDEVFAVLSDPSRHQDTEPEDWVRGAVDSAPIIGTGQMFVIDMYLDDFGGPYVMHNLVVAFEPARSIAWSPGWLDRGGRHQPGGWTWRYDLAPDGAATAVTLTYDWSGTTQQFRDLVGSMPPFGVDYIEASLAALERAVTRDSSGEA